MQLTKNVSELCALLVDDVHGEVPARITQTLLERGRSTLQEISQFASMPIRHVETGLVVLIQQNLIYYYTDKDRRIVPITYYEANPDAAYRTLRLTKIIEMVADRYGEHEAELVQSIAKFGNAKLSDLQKAYVSRSRKQQKPVHTNGHSNGGTDGDLFMSDGPLDDADPTDQTVEQLNSAISSLVEDDLLQLCSPNMMQSPMELRQAAEAEVKKTFEDGKPKGGKQQEIFIYLFQQQLLKLRDEPQRLKKELMHKVFMASNPGTKRRKLVNGDAEFSPSPRWADVAPNAIVRINFEKCDVELRNQALVQFASDSLGETTGKIYGVLLRILSRNIERCHTDDLLDLKIFDKLGETSRTIYDVGHTPVSTIEILDAIPGGLDVSIGIGKVDKKHISQSRADRIRNAPPKSKVPFADDDEDEEEEGGYEDEDWEDEDEDEDDEDEDMGGAYANSNGAKNGHTKAVKFSENGRKGRKEGNELEDGKDGEEAVLEHIRQHLLLLADSNYRFLRHTGRGEYGQWTVDFKPLVERLQQFEMESFIEQRYSRYGLRLTNILRARGKLDEKTLATVALMKKTDAQQILTRMHSYGLLEIQEVPKDNNRQASRTMFFWFYDDQKAMNNLLDNTYKSMVRCHQVLQAQRYRERNLLQLVEREDIKGHEETVLSEESLEKYRQHVKAESKLLVQLMRLDDFVAVIRDYK